METSGFHLLMEMLRMTLWIAAPVLVAALAAGLASGTVQGATAISDPSLSSVPRLLAGAAALVLAGPWMMRQLIDFTITLLSDLGRFAS
jgi:flagellar biosynthetic protein FliQ